MGNSNYQEVAQVRDQRNLQMSLEDCKRLFVEGFERENCYQKSINAFGTDEQKQQVENMVNECRRRPACGQEHIC